MCFRLGNIYPPSKLEHTHTPARDKPNCLIFHLNSHHTVRPKKGHVREHHKWTKRKSEKQTKRSRIKAWNDFIMIHINDIRLVIYPSISTVFFLAFSNSFSNSIFPLRIFLPIIYKKTHQEKETRETDRKQKLRQLHAMRHLAYKQRDRMSTDRTGLHALPRSIDSSNRKKEKKEKEKWMRFTHTKRLGKVHHRQSLIKLWPIFTRKCPNSEIFRIRWVRR